MCFHVSDLGGGLGRAICWIDGAMSNGGSAFSLGVR